MKRWSLLLILGLFFSFSTIACSPSPSATSEDIIAVLEDDGYVLTIRDEDSREYYQATQVNELYELDLDVKDLYVGYVNETERWLELVVFQDEADATSFKEKLDLEGTTGRLVYQDGPVILITYSADTISLFNESKS